MRSDRQRLADAQLFIDHIVRHLDGRPAQRIFDDARLLHAILFGLTVVAEALHWLSPDVKSLAPHVPWRSIKAMRNRLVHVYWRVDLAIVVEVVERDLPTLRTDLAVLAQRLEDA